MALVIAILVGASFSGGVIASGAVLALSRKAKADIEALDARLKALEAAAKKAL